MAEYYTVLKRAIAGIDPNQPDARRAVYDKARNALIGQLKAVDPPLTTAEISRQRLELEEAIRRAERESASSVATAPAEAVFAPEPPRHEPPPAREAEAAPPPVDYNEPPRAPPQDVFRRAVQEAGIRETDADPAEHMPVSARAMPPRQDATAPDLRRSGERPAAREPARAPLPRETRRRVPAAPPPDGYEPEPRLAPEYDQDWDEAAEPPRRGPPPVAKGREPAEGDRLAFAQKARGRGYVDEDDTEVQNKPRRSRLPSLILFLLIIGVVGGIAAFGWSQRAMLMDLLAQFESSEPPALSEPTDEPPAVAADPESMKNEDRLLAGAETQPNREVRLVGDEPDGAAAPEAIPGADGAVQVASAPDPVASGEQKAILYEEPVGDSGGGVTAIDADVEWRFVENGPNGSEVEALLEVPDRDMKIRFSLHKNSDGTLPASHLIEVTVDTPSSFPGSGVNEIPRIVLKSSEEARGEPLVGAAAKVADGFFWIALSANDADIASNLALLRGRNWIDLPFVYGNGQRAILTFEKGSPGAEVLDEAIAAWSAG